MVGYERTFVREPIDDKLFMPLNVFFENDNCDSEKLMQSILTTGYPDYRSRRSRNRQSGQLDNYRGFVLETYVKNALSRFAKEKDTQFRPSRFKSVVIANGYRLYTNNRETVWIYNPDGAPEAELDALYEFIEDSITPIIFEVTSKPSGKERSRLRRELVQQFYNSPAHFCRVQPTKGNQESGLYRRDDYSRQIVIPSVPQINDIATKLWEN